MELDTGFRPSRNGFWFGNSWRDAILGIFPSRGRCGGMVLVAQDYFEVGTPLPGEARETHVPPRDSALDRLIRKRQIESVLACRGANLGRFMHYTYVPADVRNSMYDSTLRDLPVLFDVLRAGRTAPLGLVSDSGLAGLPSNHQVLGYAAEFLDDSVVIRIYDPNYPCRDDVTLEVPLKRGAKPVEHAGPSRRVWRGVFVERRAGRVSRDRAVDSRESPEQCLSTSSQEGA